MTKYVVEFCLEGDFYKKVDADNENDAEYKVMVELAENYACTGGAPFYRIDAVYEAEPVARTAEELIALLDANFVDDVHHECNDDCELIALEDGEIVIKFRDERIFSVEDSYFIAYPDSFIVGENCIDFKDTRDRTMFKYMF